MKKYLAGLTFAASISLAVVAFGAAGAHHIRVALAPSDAASTVTGFVNLVALPQGGANVQVVAHGLVPNTQYTSFYYESADCSAPADTLETFTSDAAGNGHARGRIDDDLDEIGSVSIRLGPDYGDLIACADVHAAK